MAERRKARHDTPVMEMSTGHIDRCHTMEQRLLSRYLDKGSGAGYAYLDVVPLFLSRVPWCRPDQKPFRRRPPEGQLRSSAAIGTRASKPCQRMPEPTRETSLGRLRQLRRSFTQPESSAGHAYRVSGSYHRGHGDQENQSDQETSENPREEARPLQ